MTLEEARQVLEVDAGATQEEIHECYRYQMLAYHEDRLRSEKLKRKAKERTQRINAAYEILIGKAKPSGASGSGHRGGRGSSEDPEPQADWDGEPPPVSVANVNVFTRSALSLEERWLRAIVALGGRVESDQEAFPGGDSTQSHGALVLRLFRILSVLCGVSHRRPSSLGDLNRASEAILTEINGVYHRRSFVLAPVALATALGREMGQMYYAVHPARERCRRQAILEAAPEIRRVIESWWWWDELASVIQQVGSETWNDELIVRWIEERILERAVLKKARHAGHEDAVDELGRMVEAARAYPDVKFVELAEAGLTDAEVRYLGARLSSPTLTAQGVAGACQGRKRLHWILKDAAQQFGLEFLVRSMRVIEGMGGGSEVGPGLVSDVHGLGFAVQWRYEALGLELIRSADGPWEELNLSRCRDVAPEVAVALAGLVLLGGARGAGRAEIVIGREREALKVLVDVRGGAGRADAAVSGARRAREEAHRAVEEQAQGLRVAEKTRDVAIRRMTSARGAMERWADEHLESLALDDTLEGPIGRDARAVQAIRARRAQLV